MGKALVVCNHILKNGCEFEICPFGIRKDLMTGYTSDHNGEDIISSKYGADFITAFQDGTIEAVCDSVSGFDRKNTGGNYVYIRHSDFYQTRYLHLRKDSILVQVGQVVKKGDVIAYMGATGYSTGTHLHFEVRLNGAPQDPIPYLTGEAEITLPPDISSTSDTSERYAVGDTVYFMGGCSFFNPSAPYQAEGEHTAGLARVTSLSPGKVHPYHLIGWDNGSDVYGWVNSSQIGEITQECGSCSAEENEAPNHVRQSQTPSHARPHLHCRPDQNSRR